MKEARTNKIRSPKGMSMVELLVAVLVLTVGILAVAGVIPMAMRTITKSQTLSRAVEYTQQEMETLKRLGFNNLALVNANHFHPSGDGRYETWITVTNTTGGAIGAADNIRMVAVTTSMGLDSINVSSTDPVFSTNPDDIVTMTSYFTR